MAGEWSLTGPCAGDIIHIVYFTFSMNFLSFGCTILRGNQVIKYIFRRSTKRWKRTEPLARGFHFRKTFTFTKLSLSQICHIHKIKEAVFNIFNILQLSIIMDYSLVTSLSQALWYSDNIVLFFLIKILQKQSWPSHSRTGWSSGQTWPLP